MGISDLLSHELANCHGIPWFSIQIETCWIFHSYRSLLDGIYPDLPMTIGWFIVAGAPPCFLDFRLPIRVNHWVDGLGSPGYICIYICIHLETSNRIYSILEKHVLSIYFGEGPITKLPTPLLLRPRKGDPGRYDLFTIEHNGSPVQKGWYE
jgi:hypothetical protein